MGGENSTMCGAKEKDVTPSRTPVSSPKGKHYLVPPDDSHHNTPSPDIPPGQSRSGDRGKAATVINRASIDDDLDRLAEICPDDKPVNSKQVRTTTSPASKKNIYSSTGRVQRTVSEAKTNELQNRVGSLSASRNSAPKDTAGSLECFPSMHDKAGPPLPTKQHQQGELASRRRPSELIPRHNTTGGNQEAPLIFSRLQPPLMMRLEGGTERRTESECSRSMGDVASASDQSTVPPDSPSALARSGLAEFDKSVPTTIVRSDGLPGTRSQSYVDLSASNVLSPADRSYLCIDSGLTPPTSPTLQLMEMWNNPNKYLAGDSPSATATPCSTPSPGPMTCSLRNTPQPEGHTPAPRASLRSPQAREIVSIVPELQGKMDAVVAWLDEQVKARVKKVKKSDLTPEQLERLQQQRKTKGANRLGHVSVIKLNGSVTTQPASPLEKQSLNASMQSTKEAREVSAKVVRALTPAPSPANHGNNLNLSDCGN